MIYHDFECSTQVPESSSQTRNEIAPLHSSSEVSLNNSVSLFPSYRFFVELGGLSTSEKLKLLNGIQAVEYDRTKSLKLITQCRKLRSFRLLFNLVDACIGTRRWLRRCSLLHIKNWSFQRNRKVVARFFYSSFIFLHSSAGRIWMEYGRLSLSQLDLAISRYCIIFDLYLLIGAAVRSFPGARRFNETESEPQTK